MQQVFERYRPYSVFHAAAHKHVPLMEEQHRRGGDEQRARHARTWPSSAAEFGVEHFVLISTDKAVRPTNVMGATKRVAEQIVQEIAETHGGTSSRCGSATCSAAAAASCRRSCGRSRRAGRSRSRIPRCAATS